jgi:hypothetical protein
LEASPFALLLRDCSATLPPGSKHYAGGQQFLGQLLSIGASRRGLKLCVGADLCRPGAREQRRGPGLDNGLGPRPISAPGEAVRAPAAEIGVGVAPDRGVALEVRPFTEDRGQFFVRRLARWLVERKLKSSFSRRSRNRGPSPRRPQVSGGHNENFPNSSKWAFYNDASRAGPPSTPEPIYSGKRGCNCIGLPYDRVGLGDPDPREDVGFGDPGREIRGRFCLSRSFAPVFVPRRSSEQEIRAVLECGGLTPLSFCVSFAFCAKAVEGAVRKKGTAKAASSHRTAKKANRPVGNKNRCVPGVGNWAKTVQIEHARSVVPISFLRPIELDCRKNVFAAGALGLSWRVQFLLVKADWFAPVFVPRRSSEQEIRAVLECGGLTPLSFCVSFAFCAKAVGGSGEKERHSQSGVKPPHCKESEPASGEQKPLRSRSRKLGENGTN